MNLDQVLFIILFFGFGFGLIVYNIIVIIVGYHFSFKPQEDLSYELDIEIKKKKNPKKFWFNTILIFYIGIILLIFGMHSLSDSTDPFEFFLFPALISLVIIIIIGSIIWKKL